MLLATLSTASLLMDPIHPHAPSQQAEACVDDAFSANCPHHLYALKTLKQYDGMSLFSIFAKDLSNI